jgi:hypothetical protein
MIVMDDQTNKCGRIDVTEDRVLTQLISMDTGTKVTYSDLTVSEAQDLVEDWVFKMSGLAN